MPLTLSSLASSWQRPALRGPLLMVTSMAAFSLSDAFAKKLAADGVPPAQIAWLRYAVLGLVLATLMLRGARYARPAKPGLQLVRGGLVVGSAALFITGLGTLPIATATALVFSSPLFTTALSALLLGDRVTRARWAWTGLGFVGVVVVARPGASTFTPAALWPIASSLAWAAGMVATRRVAEHDAPGTTQLCSCVIGLVALSIALPFVGVGLDARAWLLAIAMGIVWSGGQWLALQAYTEHPPAEVAPYAYSQLIWANTLGLVLWQQWPTWPTALGTLVILAAGLGSARLAMRDGATVRAEITVAEPVVEPLGRR